MSLKLVNTWRYSVFVLSRRTAYSLRILRFLLSHIDHSPSAATYTYVYSEVNVPVLQEKSTMFVIVSHTFSTPSKQILAHTLQFLPSFKLYVFSSCSLLCGDLFGVFIFYVFHQEVITRGEQCQNSMAISWHA
jgi:hypothetical protein